MLRMTWWQEIAHSISYGRQGLEVSASIPITTLPPATGCNAASVVGAAASVPVGAAVGCGAAGLGPGGCRGRRRGGGVCFGRSSRVGGSCARRDRGTLVVVAAACHCH